MFFTLVYEHGHPVNIQSCVYVIESVSRTVCNITTFLLSRLLSLITVVFVDALSSKNKDTIFSSDKCEYFAEVAFLFRRA